MQGLAFLAVPRHTELVVRADSLGACVLVLDSVFPAEVKVLDRPNLVAGIENIVGDILARKGQVVADGGR